MKKSPTTKRTNAAQRSVASLRRHIDLLDARLILLLNQRSCLAQQIGALKKADGSALYAPEREQQVLERILNRNRGPLTDSSLVAIYREIISAALSLEGGLIVGVLGDVKGAVFAVARDRFGASATYERASSAAQALRALESGRWHAVCATKRALVPLQAALKANRVRECGEGGRGVVVVVGSAL